MTCERLTSFVNDTCHFGQSMIENGWQQQELGSMLYREVVAYGPTVAFSLVSIFFSYAAIKKFQLVKEIASNMPKNPTQDDIALVHGIASPIRNRGIICLSVSVGFLAMALYTGLDRKTL